VRNPEEKDQLFEAPSVSDDQSKVDDLLKEIGDLESEGSHSSSQAELSQSGSLFRLLKYYYTIFFPDNDRIICESRS